jgi:hypothetical protein
MNQLYSGKNKGVFSSYTPLLATKKPPPDVEALVPVPLYLRSATREHTFAPLLARLLRFWCLT